MQDSGFRFDNSYTRLPEGLFTRLHPVPVARPRMVVFNEALAGELGLDFSGLAPEALAALFSGNRVPDGADPIAQAYAGHQFGHFTILGDGRAIALGEHLTPRDTRLDIQFKGSGRTPYSRGGDGRAALGPMLREFIVSEAMHALGIPTTRSLAVVATGEPVYRETALPGAILTRVASSHIRVGTFEYTAARRQPALLRALLDYTIERHDPDLKGADNPALALLYRVAGRQAALVTHWMRVGFIHGVMNTDNMALSGETIDYGPCAFMDRYDPATVFSSIDHTGRYAFANQPAIAQWNLARFAETLLAVLDDDRDRAVAMAEEAVRGFNDRYQAEWRAMMAAKLGLSEERDGDEALIGDLLDWMRRAGADYTNTFRDLIGGEVPCGAVYRDAGFAAWHASWRQRLGSDAKALDAAFARMARSNPAVIPRNHKVEEALEAATEAGDFGPLHSLLAALSRAYDDRPELAPYRAPAASGGVYRTFCGT